MVSQVGLFSRRAGLDFLKILEARTHRSLGLHFPDTRFAFLGGRLGGRGPSSRAGLEFAADHVEVVGEDAVTGVALIAGQPDVEAAVQAVMAEAVDVAFDRAVLVRRATNCFSFSCAVSAAFFWPRWGITTVGT